MQASIIDVKTALNRYKKTSFACPVLDNLLSLRQSINGSTIGMTLIIVGILLIGFIFIATENITNVNKATVAIFMCTVGWILYIGYGTDFVMRLHANEYLAFLGGKAPSSSLVKEFIAGNVFLKYVGKACEIVLFLLATRTIVEVLDNNGCFDFISDMLRTRNSKKMLWLLGVITMVISANLDNLTTTVMMLVIMRSLVPTRPNRLIYGSAVVVAANCGGAMTVIGSPVGLMLWSGGLVSASNYFLSVFIPCLIAWIVPTWWLSRALPEQIDSSWETMPFRGDDTRLNVWQRVLMLILGIGGIWFIPTFHTITKLSPFLGALCVLSVVWVVNEIFNHRQMNMDGMSLRRIPKALFHGHHQLILFVLGMILALGVVKETGAFESIWDFLKQNGVTHWQIGLLAGATSAVLDNFATAASFITLNPADAFNDAYWKIVAYMSAVGGNALVFGSIAGIALVRTEKMRAGWYFSHVGWASIIGALAGFGVLLLLV